MVPPLLYSRYSEYHPECAIEKMLQIHGIFFFAGTLYRIINTSRYVLKGFRLESIQSSDYSFLCNNKITLYVFYIYKLFSRERLEIYFNILNKSKLSSLKSIAYTIQMDNSSFPFFLYKVIRVCSLEVMIIGQRGKKVSIYIIKAHNFAFIHNKTFKHT